MPPCHTESINLWAVDGRADQQATSQHVTAVLLSTLKLHCLQRVVLGDNEKDLTLQTHIHRESLPDHCDVRQPC